MSVQISDAAVFPHGYQGLRLWDYDIIGARYMILNHQLFDKKSVLVVNGRSGICGIAARKFTKSKSVVMTEFLPEIVDNVRKNCQKNGLDDETVKTEGDQQKQNNLITILRFNLQDIENFEAKYDIVFIVDPFRKGFPFKQFYHLLIKFLSIGGIFVGIVPQNQDDREKLFSYINQQNEKTQKNKVTKGENQYQLFELEVIRKEKELNHEQYFSSPLPNLVEGLAEFPGISQTKYAVYHIRKIGSMEQFENQKLQKKDHVEVHKQSDKNDRKQVENIEVKVEDVRVKQQELKLNQQQPKHVQKDNQTVKQVPDNIQEPEKSIPVEEVKQDQVPKVQLKEQIPEKVEQVQGKEQIKEQVEENTQAKQEPIHVQEVARQQQVHKQQPKEEIQQQEQPVQKQEKRNQEKDNQQVKQQTFGQQQKQQQLQQEKKEVQQASENKPQEPEKPQVTQTQTIQQSENQEQVQQNKEQTQLVQQNTQQTQKQDQKQVAAEQKDKANQEQIQAKVESNGNETIVTEQATQEKVETGNNEEGDVKEQEEDKKKPGKKKNKKKR